ncbi:3',5'-cyclic AMP phosphodiesterase CpdA [Glycomyces sambucus]|uniref:3',5'-cyclic AMP phosphodiesterase CpdA n=1 Tax=Glycomyces sambucus TaxID=380244 RepID=A0A1G9KBA6_9ACTN|nr:metallophosphoesterase [Glycomyces sambucus]SDL47021.1 3',5'-cyclic AMP phosphodiesterase CpdA [Glycomyces sambucus]
MRVLHLSDTHLTGDGALHRMGIDAAEALAGLLAHLAPLRRIDLVVVTGDVADDGSPGAYRLARDMIGAFAAERGAPLVFTTGNADDRDAFAEVLGSGHLDTGPRGSAFHEAAIDAVHSPERAAATAHDGVRLITLDTLVPGKVHGRIGAAQLDWLRGLLAAPAPRGTVLAFHHPPIRFPNAVQDPATLINPGDLAEAIEGTDVRVILCGHYHLQLAGRLGDAMVWTGPAVVNRRDLSCGDEAIRYVHGSAATLIDLADLRAPVFHTLQPGDTLREMGGEQLREALRHLGPED